MNLISKILEGFKTPSPLPKPLEKEISPELMRNIRAIQVKTSHLVTDLMAGEYVSAFKGRGVEFSEVREYMPGDDVRLIDWNVPARMDQPFIKDFKIASILAFAAIRNNDKIGLIVFSDKIERTIPPKKGKAHIWNIIRTILNFNPEGRGTDLNLPLEYLLKVQKRKCVAFLISDFQAEGYETNLKLAEQKHDLVAITITDPREIFLPPVGFVHLQDAELGETLLVDTRDRELMERLAAKERDRKKIFLSLGVDTIEIETNRSLVEPIIRYFKLREQRH